MNFSRSAEEMAESIYLIDISNNQLEQHFADGRTITTPMGSGAGNTSARSWIASMHTRRKKTQPEKAGFSVRLRLGFSR